MGYQNDYNRDSRRSPNTSSYANRKNGGYNQASSVSKPVSPMTIPEDYLDQALVAAKPEQKLCFLGDGVERYRTAIEARLGQRAVFAPAQMSYLRPAAVAALAWQNRENAVDYLTLQPHYLRAPQADRARAARQAAEGKA